MKKYQLFLTEMAPNGTNDLIIVDSNTLEVENVIEECCFGYPSNTAIKPDIALTCGVIDDIEVLDDPEISEAGISQGLYSVTINAVLKCIAVNPCNNGTRTLEKLNSFGLLQG